MIVNITNSSHVPAVFPRDSTGGIHRSVGKVCLRFWRQGKMLDWAVIFFITAMLAALTGYLGGGADSALHYMALLSLASLLMGVAGLFLDTWSRG